MKIDELVEKSGLTKRNIRYLTSEGIVPEPIGAKRGASYGPEHLKALEIYSNLKAQGVTSLEVIRQAVESPSYHLLINTGEGFEVRIEERLIKRNQPDELLEIIRAAVEKALRERKGEIK